MSKSRKGKGKKRRSDGWADSPEIELIPGNPGKPLFKSRAEQDEFYERFGQELIKAQEKLPKPIRFLPYRPLRALVA